MITFLEMVGTPLRLVVDSIEAAIDARSLSNAREAAVDSSLRAGAHQALRDGSNEMPVAHFPESA